MKKLLVGVVALTLLGACGSRVRDWPDDMVVAEDTTTAVVDDDDAGDGSDRDRDDESTHTTRRAGTATSAKPTGPTTTVKSALPHPAPGRYTYDVEFTIPAFDDEPATSEKDTYDVTWAVSGTASSLTLVESDDSDTATTYRLTSTGLELQSIKYEDDDDTYTCNYKPTQLFVKLPLTQGATWSTDSTCTYEDGEVDRTMLQAKVTGTATDAIGGARVETVIVQWTDTTTEKYPDDDEIYTYKAIRTAHVDPKTLLIVSEEIRDQSEDGLSAVSTRRLQSLTPR